MTILNIYTYALPFLVIAGALVVYWWTGREDANSNKHRAG